MPEDVHLPFEYDESGDVATVDGQDFYYQHALQLGLLVGEDIKGGAATEADLLEFESDLVSAFTESPYFSPPIQVRVLDSPAGEIKIEVHAGNVDDFEVTL